MRHAWRRGVLAVVLVAAIITTLLWMLRPATTIVMQAQSVKTAVGAVSARAIVQTDLPPAGTRSLFDHLIAQNDGLPYPFEKLVALVQDQHPAAEMPVNVLIPDGRSLLKGLANNKHPRVLIAADFELANNTGVIGLKPRGQLFLGFVEKANEIEVLSYNEAAGRFEFQLVQNYCAGCVPRIIYAQRAICTTCHQGGGPLFPQRPWNETNAQPDTAEAISKARVHTERYLTLPIKNILAASERFDQLTDEGNFISVTQRIWLDGCGQGGTACRRTLLKLALRYRDNPGGFDPQQPLANTLRQYQAQSFPKNGIAVPESDLFNRDPLSERRGIKSWWSSMILRDKTMSVGAINNEDLEAFDRLPKLAPRLDPLTQRQPKQVLTAQDIDGVYGLAALFSSGDIEQISQHMSAQSTTLDAKVDALPEGLFADKPVMRIAILRALLNDRANYCCLSTEDMSPPQASGVPALVIEKHPVLKDFETYCFACHRGNPAKRLNFMAGLTENDVLASIKDKSEIRDALDWERYSGTDKANTLMPPRDSIQYEALVTAGKQGSSSMKRMRESVPTLFGF